MPHPRQEASTTYDLERAITDRLSIRMFQTDRPVPRELVDEDSLGVGAPSNSKDNVVFHDY
jgi:hypothetical protein